MISYSPIIAPIAIAGRMVSVGMMGAAIGLFVVVFMYIRFFVFERFDERSDGVGVWEFVCVYFICLVAWCVNGEASVLNESLPDVLGDFHISEFVVIDSSRVNGEQSCVDCDFCFVDF